MGIRKTFPRIRGVSPEIARRAQKLRRNMTPAEETLWAAISNKKLKGLRFRASHPIGRFILDFYCPAHKLVVEVDGSHHAEQKQRDDERTAYLSAFGYRVVRFKNDEVMQDLPAVLEAIVRAAEVQQAGA